SEPKSAPAGSLSVATETVAAWVRAEIVDTFRLTETMVRGRALVRYDIANAPVKTLRVKVPADFHNVEITGPNIRSREPARDVWHVELQSPISGFYTLTVTWDQARTVKTNLLVLAGISAEGVERETGLLAVSAKAPLQVSESAATGLQRVDTSDFPDWAGNPDPATALAYRYVRPGFRFVLNVRRFDEAEVLQALIDHANFTSVAAEDGQMMTEMSLALRSNGRQFLEVELPAGANVWSAFVAGQPVRPSLRDGKLLLPIQQAGAGDSALSVDLTYVGTNAFPRTRGNVGFVSPKFDVPVKSAHWEIYLPLDYDYEDFTGTMTREVVRKPDWISASFSGLEYSRMEQASKASAKVEIQRDVNEARRQLASGDVRAASANFYRAKAQSYGGKSEGDGFKQLEKTLQSAAASNLIMAQKDFTLRNAGQTAGRENRPEQSAELGLRYDDAAAEEQWARLQQAQELTTTRVQPLRVNLPVRGQPFAFTQVLQTEAGKPMTIQLSATNDKAVNWPVRGFTVAGAFLALWGLVAILVRLSWHVKNA
ncbi:MAG TPA: hypothetical protein VKA67_12885, partial [Verrucomicrobiae bacterium]|nr:hypothetical protein [Verrucomicrobiae bacterium]